MNPENSCIRSGARYLPQVHKLAQLDHAYIWHPFTQMKDWLKTEPIIIMRGKGSLLYDQKGKEYVDANSSIWTNLHGHQNKTINKAITRQLKKIAHSSALGLANEPASLLASELVKAAQPRCPGRQTNGLGKVFFSDDGSTAVEVALKLSFQFWRLNGVKEPKFLSLGGAYHGDTVGATSIGHIDLFHKAYGPLLFKTEQVMPPYCYRCPFNRSKPERGDARIYRKCNWECVAKVEEKFTEAQKLKQRITAMVIEPGMQGPAGIVPQPAGWLLRVGEIIQKNNAHLVADEVMTGFGRVAPADEKEAGWFASLNAGLKPDFLALAKGLTGGYLPMAATLTTQAVFDSFLGEYEEFKTFFHGHSYTANQVGSAAALASLELLQSSACTVQRAKIAQTMRDELGALWGLPQVGDVRQEGTVAGIELVRDWRTRRPYDLRERAGMRVCEAMSRRGVLTRPIGNVIVLMPPYCTSPRQVRKIIAVLAESITECLG